MLVRVNSDLVLFCRQPFVYAVHALIKKEIDDAITTIHKK